MRGWPWQFAHLAAERGWYTFPCEPGDKVPVRGVKWRDESTIDHAQLERWEAEHAEANTAIDLARSGLLVIDVDVKIRQDDGTYLPTMDGYHDLAALFTEHDWWPQDDDLQVITPSGGWHLYFTQPDPPLRGRTQKAGPLGHHIDVKAHGGYVLGPGSRVHPAVAVLDGNGLYRKHRESSFDQVPLVPDWLALLVSPPPPPPPSPMELLRQFKANKELAQGGWTRRVNDLRYVAAGGGSGTGRNDALNATAYGLRAVLATPGGPSLAEVVRALGEACEANGLAGDGPNAVRATIASGLGVGFDVVRGLW